MAWSAAIAFLTIIAFCYWLQPQVDIPVLASIVLLSIAVWIFAVDLAVNKVHRNPTAGMDYRRRNVSLSRSLTKLLGLWGSIGLLALIYFVFPVYGNDLYDPFLSLAASLALPFAVLSGVYVVCVDMYQKDPNDSYWHMGCAMRFKWGTVDGAIVWDHIRGWLVKAFFLPLMFGFFCGALRDFLSFDFGSLESFVQVYAFLFTMAFFFDLSVSTIGYATTFRPLDTYIRSVEPTTLGWLVCLICYAPFWVFLTENYLNYETDWQWGNWLWDNPLAYGVWGVLILLCLSVYIYATAQFGCRFSNLTYRGLITSGPYRWTKHPAYIFKNISWWLIAIPFIPGDGSFETAFRNCLLLAGVSGIYFLRARTEEAHLSRYPEYVAYARWIAENGIFRWVPKLPFLGWVAYRPRGGNDLGTESSLASQSTSAQTP